MGVAPASPVGTGPVETRLVEWLRLLVDAGAVTGSERALADDLAGRLGADHRVRRVGDSLVVGEPPTDRPCVALVGHLDVVPPTDVDLPLRIEDRTGELVAVGRGTSDMHAGNAVALTLFDEEQSRTHVDLVLVLYAREEGPADDNELADVLDGLPWLADVDLAVVLEPTDGEIHLGCLGGLHASVRFLGRQAHSARPWHGRNAVTAAGRFLAALDELAPQVVSIDGIEYRDVWSITQASTTSARNVIPGEFTLNLNFRFSPSRGVDAAAAELRDRVASLTADISDAQVEVEITDVAQPAPPGTDAPLVQRLLAATTARVGGKQAWTDVARLAAVGVPAVNYGPGLTPQAHQRGEHVPVAAMVDVHDRLRRFLVAGP